MPGYPTHLKSLIAKLRGLSEIPATNSADWLSSAEASVEFLKESLQSPFTILYASAPRVYIHAVLAPLRKLKSPDKKDLEGANLSLDDSWAIEHVSGGGKPDRVYLRSPLSAYSKTLEGGEKLVFRRSFAGAHSHPVEISQKLVHSLDLHFIEERNAFCRLDEDGDLEDVINVVEVAESQAIENFTLVTVRTKELTDFMVLNKSGLVVFFDFTRVDHKNFSHWGDDHNRFKRDARDLFYHGGVLPNQASYVNGRLIARPNRKLSDIVKEKKEARNPSKQDYAIFKAINLKTGDPIEVSCAPNGLSNYFEPNSELPLEMSPAFFKAEVLHKYKADPGKYTLEDRSICCRGTWHLDTYDINEAGQVHTYLAYLSHLPYKEQLYWQSFNEWPKGPISRRAFTTDFKGEFFDEYDPLNSLKRKVYDLDEAPRPWWAPRGKAMRDAVRYPATSSGAEWGNEILALDQLLVEGFQLKELRKFADAKNRPFEQKWGSLKLLEECLIAAGTDEDHAKKSMSSLRALHDLRTILKGHAAPSKRAAAEQYASKTFGSYKAHFSNLVAACDDAMSLILDALK